MKRGITLPSTTCIFIIQFVTLAVFICAANSAYAFFPKSAQELTVFDNNYQVYQQACPKMNKVISLGSNKNKLTAPFTLLNWNIYKQRSLTWKEKLTEWGEKSDLITLQEVKHSQELINFSRLHNLLYFQNYAFSIEDEVYGVNTLSRNIASHVCGTRYPEPWILIPKTGIATIYPLDKHNNSLLVINLHGVNFTFTSEPLKEQLLPYLVLIKQHQGAVIFSGDFNTWSNARLEEVQKELINTGFDEALFANDQRLKIFGRPVDHIYFRGLKVIKAESLATDASDHSPQLVTFDLE